MGKELELKYRIGDQEQFSSLCDLLEERYPGNWSQIAMATTYYDTPTGAMGARKWTLRVRRENEDTVVTVKTPASGGARGEWECRGTDPVAAVPRLTEQGAPKELEVLLCEGVVPVCGAAFTRRAIPVQTGDTVVEVALDTGRLFREDRELPLCELEVELKEGSEAECAAFAHALAEKFGLTPEPRSKFARAVSL